jgi:hypothetical protein
MTNPPICQSPLEVAIQKGIALDLLFFFTTEYGTSEVRSLKEVKQRYRHIENIDRLLNKLVKLQLLIEQIEYNQSNNWNPSKSTGKLRLSHDTLGPLIRKEFESSFMPGQIARKLLKQKLLVSEVNKQIPLNSKELKLIESGKPGMRLTTQKEEVLILTSRQNLSKRKRRFWGIGVALILIFLIGGYLIFKAERTSKGNTLLISADVALRNKQFKESVILAVGAEKYLNNERSSTLLYESCFNCIFYEDNALNGSNLFSKLPGNFFSLSEDRFFFTTYKDESLTIGVKKNAPSYLANYSEGKINQLGKLSGQLGSFTKHNEFLYTSLLERDSSYLYKILSPDSVQLVKAVKGCSGVFSPDLKYLITSSLEFMYVDEKRIESSYVYSTNSGKLIDSLEGNTAGAIFSDDGRYFVTELFQQPRSCLYHISENGTAKKIRDLPGIHPEFLPGNHYIIFYNYVNEQNYIYFIDQPNSNFIKFLNSTIFTTPFSNILYIIQNNQNKSYLISISSNGQLDSISMGNTSYITYSPNKNLAVTLDRNNNKSYLYEILPNKFQLRDSIDKRIYQFLNDNESILFYENKNVCLYTVSDIYKLQKIECFKILDDLRYDGNNIITSYDEEADTSIVYYVSSGKLSFLQSFRGNEISLSPDKRFLISVTNDNNFNIFDLKEKITTRIILPRSEWGTSFIGKNGLILSSKLHDSVLIWPNNPLIYPIEKVFSNLHFDKKFVDSLQTHFNFDL